MQDAKLTLLPSFELLGYHLKVLYVIEYFGRATIGDLESVFPSNTIQRLEVDTASIKFGRINAQAIAALVDLIQNDLVCLYTQPYEIQLEASLKETLNLLEQRGEISTNEKTKLLQKAIIDDHYFQSEEYWCYDPQTQAKVVLSKHGVIAFLSVTEKGKEIWKMLPTVRTRLFKELINFSLRTAID